MLLLSILFLLALILIPLWVIGAIRRNHRDIARLRERVDELERRLAREAGLAPQTLPRAHDTPPAEELPRPIPIPTAPVASTASPPGATRAPAPALWLDPIPRPARAAFDTSRIEQLIGGIWLQNVGSVLLLLGIFFLILWGYTTGRIGPGVLVAAGVALGVACAWRGDVLTRSVPAFGNAVIGIGLGIVYLSLYLGHFTLHALGRGPAFALLTVVSLATVAIGLSHRAQTVAAFGVVGAFLPQLIAAWVPLRGFSLPAHALLLYLAFVDLVVFALAAAAGWSALDLAALVLTAATWSLAFAAAPWGWGIEIGLAGLFVLLGLAPLPRLSRRDGVVRPRELAVIALAPLCLIVTSWPFLDHASRNAVAMLLVTLAAIYVAAALWVDARRPERDLWRPLTGAAVLFLTAALERALGPENTPLAWIVEGAVLIWIGLSPRGGWLRLSGYVVEAMGAVWLLVTLVAHDPWDPAMPPLVHAIGIRQMVALAALVATAAVLARGREHLDRDERLAPEVMAVVANGLLLLWSSRESAHLARALIGPPAGPLVGSWTEVLAGHVATLACAAAMIQAAVLLGIGLRDRAGVLRACAYVLAGWSVLRLQITLLRDDPWRPGQSPLLNLPGLVELACVGALMAMAAWMYRRRERLAAGEIQVQEIATVVANLAMLAWLGREGGHLARSLAIPASAVLGAGANRTRTLSAVFTSAGWMIQAVALLAIGWTRRTGFMRWLGLGLFGLTVIKFLLLDLQQVDVFWRFLTAILVGVALLAVSYLYQRRSRAAVEPAARE